MNPKNILVIGGSGFVGSAIVSKLAALGNRVVVPTRRRERAKHLILLPTADVVQADVRDDTVLAGLVAAKDVVINLVGILHGDNARPYGRRFAAAHVELPRRIAAACASAGVPRLLHMSALGVGHDAPSMYLRSKAAGEDAVRDSAGGSAWTIFRPSVIFGREDRFINLFALMQRFLPVMAVGGADARLQPVHVEDVASAFVNAIDTRATFGGGFELAGPKQYSLREIIAFAGRPYVVSPLTLDHDWRVATSWALATSVTAGQTVFDGQRETKFHAHDRNGVLFRRCRFEHGALPDFAELAG